MMIADVAEYLSVEDRRPESLMRRLDELARQAASPLMGFPLGKMKMRGELGENATAKFDAAAWFFQLHADHAAVIGAKSIPPQSHELGSKGEPPDPASDRGKRVAKRERRTVREYNSAKLAGLACGANDWGYFLAVVIQECEPNWSMKSAVRRVCEALRKHRAENSRHRRGNRA